MTQSSAPPNRTLRRGLIGLIGLAIVALGILVASQIGTLFPGGAVAATRGPVPSTSAAPSPTLVAAEPSPSAVPPTEPPPSSPPPPNLVPAPLTGLLVTPEAAARHVIAVMIDDLSPARPQSGFNSASIVWHAPAEGGIPRYMMLFQDTIPQGVGPVRSSREYYIEWAAEWDAMYVHAGGSPQALQTLAAKGHGQWVYNADEFRWGGIYFHRTKDRFAPHNVYTSGKELYTLSRRLGAKNQVMKPAWRFAPDASLAFRPVGGTISTVYPWNTITYRYDRATNTYRRSVSGEKRQTDRGRKAFVAPKNVIVMSMSFAPLNDGSKKHRLEAQFIGQGPAWISTNGKTIKGTWKKTSMTSPTRFYDKAGNLVTLTVGQTFVQVMPRGSKITIKDGKVPKYVPTLQQVRSERL